MGGGFGGFLIFFFKAYVVPVIPVSQNNNVVVTQKNQENRCGTTQVLIQDNSCTILLLMLNITHSTDQFLMQHLKLKFYRIFKKEFKRGK